MNVIKKIVLLLLLSNSYSAFSYDISTLTIDGNITLGTCVFGDLTTTEFDMGDGQDVYLTANNELINSTEQLVYIPIKNCTTQTIYMKLIGTYDATNPEVVPPDSSSEVTNLGVKLRTSDGTYFSYAEAQDVTNAFKSDSIVLYASLFSMGTIGITGSGYFSATATLQMSYE